MSKFAKLGREKSIKQYTHYSYWGRSSLHRTRSRPHRHIPPLYQLLERDQNLRRSVNSSNGSFFVRYLQPARSRYNTASRPKCKGRLWEESNLFALGDKKRSEVGMCSFSVLEVFFCMNIWPSGPNIWPIWPIQKLLNILNQILKKMKVRTPLLRRGHKLSYKILINIRCLYEHSHSERKKMYNKETEGIPPTCLPQLKAAPCIWVCSPCCKAT